MAKKKQNKSLPKWLILGGIFVVLLAVIWKPYWNSYFKNNVQPNPSAAGASVPSDWKTYSNDKYGLSIKYPPAWNLSTPNNNYTIFDISSDTDDSNRVSLYKNFQGDICDGPAGHPIEEIPVQINGINTT